MGISLAEWIEENDLKRLEENIQCHCDVYGVVDADDFTRLVMISVRDALTEKERE